MLEDSVKPSKEFIGADGLAAMTDKMSVRPSAVRFRDGTRVDEIPRLTDIKVLSRKRANLSREQQDSGMKDSLKFLEALVDSLDQQVAVIDSRGQIVFVNRAWREFGRQNGAPDNAEAVGCNYFEACLLAGDQGDPLARDIADGLRRVVQGEATLFEAEYPCHSPTLRRWFIVRAIPLPGLEEPLVAVFHTNVTPQKLAEEKALRDPLTGLANRRRMDEFLYFEWQRCIRSASEISLILFDVDHFKQYNDEQGHLQGDRCLKQIAQTLRRFVRRPSDLVCRFGGEEFVVVLGETGLSDALVLADRMRLSVRDLDLEWGGGHPVTISGGVAAWRPQRGEIEGLLVERADKALYQAKLLGRNRVEFSAPPG